jgi:hypothetical protein
VGGIKEYFPVDYGNLIEKNNKEQLLKAILEVFNSSYNKSPTAMHQFIVDNFSPMSIAQQFDALYD